MHGVKAVAFKAIEEARQVHVTASPRRGSCTRQRGAA